MRQITEPKPLRRDEQDQPEPTWHYKEIYSNFKLNKMLKIFHKRHQNKSISKSMNPSKEETFFKNN